MTQLISEALDYGKEQLEGVSDTPRIDTECLLMHVLEVNRAHLRAWPEKSLSTHEAEVYRKLIQRRGQGTPVAYLTGSKEFWSRSFLVGHGVLVPRPETELLVELAINRMSKVIVRDLLDLGTGSGVIAITLALEYPETRIMATDCSEEALHIARSNAQKLVAHSVEFRMGNWLEAIPPGQTFQVIVSNPPYIPSDDPHLKIGDLRFEPKLALESGIDGLDAIRRLCEQARSYLEPDGLMIVEHGYDQAEPVRALMHAHGYINIMHHKDLQGHDRATSAQINLETIQ